MSYALLVAVCDVWHTPPRWGGTYRWENELNTGSNRRPIVGIAMAAAISSLLVTSGLTAHAAEKPNEVSKSKKLRKAVTAAGMYEHLNAFQAIADRNGGNRVSGTPGFDQSKDYVADRLEAAGYDVTVMPFDFQYNADRTTPVFAQVSPDQQQYTDGTDFASMTFSPNGDATAEVSAVDLVVPSPGTSNGNTSACEAADFAGFTAGHIALVQRGTCSFAQKADNAAAAGASAVIVFNEGQEGRTAAVAGTLGGPASHDAPVIGTTFAIGDDLRNGVLNGPTGSTAQVKVDRTNEQRTTYNVLADFPAHKKSKKDKHGDKHAGKHEPGPTVVVGAHLDSVPRGPGINDNGSGSAGILEIAEQIAERNIKPRNQLRFAFWGAEEFGLIGSERYVESLSQAEKDAIALNLNFDMIGSPNYARFVYDGDNSAFPVGPGAAEGPEGSGEIERVFHHYFDGVQLASGETPFSGRSDYGPFIAEGIPAGGLFTGAEGIKTAREAELFGGTAGVAYDQCYHLACDDVSNVNRQGIDEMADAAAHATFHFATRDFAKDPLVDPAGPVGGDARTSGGGGLHADHDHEVTH